MNRIAWIVLMVWAASAPAQINGFQPLSKPEVSKLLTKAREGSTKSQLRLGTAYQYGLGVEQDSKTAEYWLKLAAGYGDPEAQTQLGVLYLQPEFASSRAQSVRWFLRAAADGYANAEHNLGLLYLLGIGVTADREQAIHWFRRASQHGSAPSRANLGVLLVNSKDAADQKEGFDLVNAAAKAGSGDAENALGYCYQFGAGTDVDAGKAFAMYKVAAEHGNWNAMVNLAEIYRTGAGAEKNVAEAFRWYSKACDLGERRACVGVANAYLHGEGVQRDPAMAYRFGMMADADRNTLVPLEKSLPEEARNRAAEEAERWKQAHAIQLSASPR